MHIVSEHSELFVTLKEEIIFGRNFDPYLQKMSSAQFLKLVNLKTLSQQNVQFLPFLKSFIFK